MTRARRPRRRRRRRDVVGEGRRDLDAGRHGQRRRREVGPREDHAPSGGIVVGEFLVRRVDRAAAAHEAVRVGGGTDDERPLPRVTEVGRPVHAHRLRRGRPADVGDDDREIEEGRSAGVLDLGIAEDLRVGGSGNRRDRHRDRQRPSVDERRAAVVGIHEAGHRQRTQSEPARVVDADDDVLTRGVDGDRGFGLSAGRAVARVEVVGRDDVAGVPPARGARALDRPREASGRAEAGEAPHARHAAIVAGSAGRAIGRVAILGLGRG